MKKLNENEFENLYLKGKGRSSHVFNSLINLKIGEAVLIEKKDWTRKASPSTLVRYIEKNHNMKFTCGAVGNGSGWAVKRIEKTNELPENKQAPAPQQKQEAQPIIVENKNTDNRLLLKSDLVVFYLGRMAFYKIEKIEDSVKACKEQFWKQEPDLVTELFKEIIGALSEQGHIIIENEKTYIPLRRI